MGKRILDSLLFGLVGAMGVFFFSLILGISSGEDGKSRAAVGMLIGGVSSLVICGALSKNLTGNCGCSRLIG